MATQKSKQNNTPWAEIGGQCLAVRIRVLNRAITAIYDEAMRKHGVTVAQLNLLTATGHFGQTRPSRISKALQMDHTTTSRNVERMLNNGWLEYVPDTDGRARPFQLSRTGKKLLRDVLPDWRAAQKRAKEFLGQQTVDAVTGRVSQMWLSTNGELE